MSAQYTHSARSLRRIPALASVATLALLAASGNAFAADLPVVKGPPPAPVMTGLHYRVGDIDIFVSGTVTVGTEIRTTGVNPLTVGGANAKLLGVTSFNPGGRNGDDGELNWAKGKVVSTVAKGFLAIDANLNGFGAFVRPKVWYDATLANAGVPWGNLPGGYLTGRPLNEGGWNPNARALGVDIGEAYGYVKRNVGPVAVDARVGNIIVPWGLPTLLGGGLRNAVNGVDNPAAFRPGAQPEEIFRATPGSFLKLGFLDNRATLEGFYLFKAPRNVAPGCGTFFAVQDWVGPGCNAVTIANNSDPWNLLVGGYAFRLSTPSDSQPQYGVGGTFLVDAISTKFGLYYSHVAWTAPVPGSTKGFKPNFQVGNGAGTNSDYYTVYPDGVNSFTFNFQTQIQATKLYGEYVYRANAPIALNSSDVLNAFATGGAAAQPTLLRAQVNWLLPGSFFNAYDRLRVGSLVLGGSQAIPDILGARALVLGAEFGMKSVYDLPDKEFRRYGRYDGFGVGQVLGVCSANSIYGQCSNDGYVSANAWGYRLTAALQYQDVFVSGLSVTPSVGIAHDVKGWAYDQTMYQGRVVLNLALRAEYDKKYFAEIKLAPQLHTSLYDNGQDRQYLSIAAGMRF